MKTNTKICEEVSFFLGEISPEKTGENNFIKESFIEVYLGMIVRMIVNIINEQL